MGAILTTSSHNFEILLYKSLYNLVCENFAGKPLGNRCTPLFDTFEGLVISKLILTKIINLLKVSNIGVPFFDDANAFKVNSIGKWRTIYIYLLTDKG